MRASLAQQGKWNVLGMFHFGPIHVAFLENLPLGTGALGT